MADYNCTDKQEIVAVAKITDNTEIRVARLTDEKTGDVKSVDIRQWFCTKSDPTMKPSKGIRIKDEQTADILWGILQSMSQEAKMDFDSAHPGVLNI